MDVCPACESPRVFRSRTRTALERLRRQFTMKRPFRCHACNWRGWGTETERSFSLEDVREADAPQPDLNAINSALEESRRKGVNDA